MAARLLSAMALASAFWASLALAGGLELTGVFPGDDTLVPGERMPICYESGADGTLEVLVRMSGGGYEELLESLPVAPGPGTVYWDGTLRGAPVPPGDWIVQLTLVDSEGARSAPSAVEVRVTGNGAAINPPPVENAGETDGSDGPRETAASAQRTPFDRSALMPGEDRQISPYPDPHDLCAWNLDIDRIDLYSPEGQAKIWEVLMQPVTVLDAGPKEHVYPLVSPDADPKEVENLTGQIHGRTAGVHVLETLDNGWSLIEAYSTDGYGSPDDEMFHGLCNRLIQGYVRTKQLKTVTPYDKMGLVIDKYTQRMHVFRDGKLFTTLLISTGFPTNSQPWNETPSGEYLVDSKVGKFPAADMQCDLAFRVNGGCLIHEVPHKVRGDGTRNYEPFEPYLGKKASHGCVRVQRMRNNDGVNMAWMWNHLKPKTRVLIWDDTGRAPIPVPEWALTMYYNPNGGKNYHSEQRCSAVRDRFLPLTELPYESLYRAPTNALIPCYGCVPFFKVADLDAAIPDDVMGAEVDDY